MKKPFFWEKAKKALISKDKKLGKIIKRYPSDFLFLNLIHSILFQDQLLDSKFQ